MKSTNTMFYATRMTNCSIVGDRLNFSEILERARALEFDENAPNIVFFRRPIYASPEYHQNYDFQIAQYYSSFNEMRERRSASGNNAYGRLSISCGPGYVATNVIINQDDLEDQSLMTTRRCTFMNGGDRRSAFNRLRQASDNIAADSGNTTMAQMWIPSLGGPMNQSFDFVFALSTVFPFRRPGLGRNRTKQTVDENKQKQRSTKTNKKKLRKPL